MLEVTDIVRQPFGIVHGGGSRRWRSHCARAQPTRRRGDGGDGSGQPGELPPPGQVRTSHPPPRRAIVGVRRGSGTATRAMTRAACALARVTIAVRPPRPDPAQPLKRFVIGSRRSRPKARLVILIPGGAWRRLYRRGRRAGSSPRRCPPTGPRRRAACTRGRAPRSPRGSGRAPRTGAGSPDRAGRDAAPPTARARARSLISRRRRRRCGGARARRRAAWVRP